MATIKDVAKLAGVSVATVSRVLNQGENVQPETERKVRSAIKALRYSPNLLGRNLRRRETRKILVLLNTISNQFYSRVVRGIEECAAEQEYSVMIGMTHGDPKLERNFLEMLKTKLMDGAVFLTSELDGAELAAQLQGIPVVQACEVQSTFPTPWVSIDNRRAACEATRYLVEKGHRQIGFFGAGDTYGSSRQREEGFRLTMEGAGLPIREEWVLDEGFGVGAGIRAAERLLESGSLPDAVFCVSDTCAAGAIRCLAGEGVLVPRDISVMGFDNIRLSEVFLPSITTTWQPQYEIGYRAMEMLLRLIGGEEPSPNRLVLEHRIIERESVSPKN